ncbi:hypothetical protein BC826DRAFT_1058503 [Russula brevipes]|nr:hypothetical protein BC826DRAFT_1058503 [Russula brevipes]
MPFMLSALICLTYNARLSYTSVLSCSRHSLPLLLTSPYHHDPYPGSPTSNNFNMICLSMLSLLSPAFCGYACHTESKIQ